MPFHPLPHPHIGRPAASAPWLLRLMAFVLGALLLWAFICSAAHDSGSHTYGRTTVSYGHVPLAAEAVERQMPQPHGPHPHHGSACVPYVVSHVLPQARQLFTGAAALAAFAGVAAGVTAAVAALRQAAWPGPGRYRIRPSGRSTFSVVCRWRI
jgi:hypothetical protein